MAVNATASTLNSRHLIKSVAEDLSVASERFVSYLPVVFVLLGSVGFLGNLFTYLQSELRSNTYCIYSLCGSTVDIITLLVNLFPNYLSSKHAISMWPMSTLICKINLFLLVFLPHLSLNFLLVSTLDRFASTCHLTSPFRRINQLKAVPRISSVTILYSALTSVQASLLFHYATGPWCEPTHPATYAALYILLNGLMPPLMMFVVIFLTFRNIRLSRRRVGGVNVLVQRRSRNQFILTIFTQVIATGFFSLQWIVFYMYFIITAYDMKSFEQTSIEVFVSSVTNNCFYLNHVKSFYLSMLTCHLFRKTVRKSLIDLLPRHLRASFQAINIRFSVHTISRSRRDNVPRR